MTKLINLTGQVFIRLTVIGRAENNKSGHPQWLCKCICGNKIIITSSNLRNGHTKSCGCLRSEKSKKRRILLKGEAAFRKLFSGYKHRAKKKSIKFNLNKEQFKILVDGNCVYCGMEPQQICKNPNGNGDYIYNGIDRIDNTNGYIINNCVSCCKRCND